MMSANEKNLILQQAITQRLGLTLPLAAVQTLRRAAMTLHRWAEMECGDGNGYASWAIERDEVSGLPYLCTYPHTGAMRRSRIPDREAGALRRVRAVCLAYGLHFYHQTDPRGCALYVSTAPLSASDYTDGVPCCT